MGASGFAGLGYQIVWTQQCALWLGHDAAAVLAVLSAFFGGLAVGAWSLGRRVDRSARPARWYVACEALIAVWSVVLALGMAPIAHGMLALTGAQPTPLWQWGVAFVGTFLLLLPATAAMGATLPAMARVMKGMSPADRPLAALYAANTFGAVVGVLVTAFWLLPGMGLLRTAALCAALNVLCAAVALRFESGHMVLAPQPGARPEGPRPLALLAATGLLGIGYEVLVVRVLSQVAEDTVYTYALLLATYLIGSAVGAAAYQRVSARRRVPDATLQDWLLYLLATACLLGTASLWGAEHVHAVVVDWLGPGSMTHALAAEATLAALAFGLPTVAMGAVFCHLSTQAAADGTDVGRCLGINLLGGAWAPPLFGVLVVPTLGLKFALLGVIAGYLALLPWRMWRRPAPWLPAGAVLAFGLVAPPLAYVDVPEGGHIASYREGVLASVSVVEDAEGVLRLRIDNRQQEGSSSSLLADARQALLPLLLHPAPQHALFLGLGTGMTAASAAQEASLQVDAVELLPEVVAASTHFTPVVGDGRENPRLHLITADARRYVRSAPQSYDLIVSDNFHPARSGAGSLYTVEHFQAVRERLSASGLFCQWLPLHQLDLDTLRSIVASFMAVFPDGAALLATNSLDTPVLGLVARRDGQPYRLEEVRARLQGHHLPQQLDRFGLPDELALLGSFVAGPTALKRYAGNAPLNTDDHPIVAYRAPRLTYAPDSQPRERLLALLQQLTIEPGEVVSAETDPAWLQRLAAYRAARDRYLSAGLHVQPTSDLQRMLSQVREPLLAVLRISPDFRPAYDPLLRMALTLGHTDPAGARTLLTALQEVQPARPEAVQALRQLQDVTP